MAATDFTDRFVYDGVSRLVQSRQWVRRSPDAGSDIFTDGFESGDTTAWVEFQESYLADVYTEQTFTFDIPGNLLSVDTDGDVRTHSVSSATNRLTGSAQYDGAGNLTQFTDESGQTVTFEYDAFNRLIYREQDSHFTHFLYTADDERILRFGTGGFTWSLRDFQGRVLREFRPESNRLQPIRDHIYRGSSPIATVTVDENDILSKRHHLSLDHLGSPRYVTDGAGNFIAEHKYYPFGEEATRPAQNDLPLKFTGHERDFYADGASDDLDYMHARFCDPRVGRFLSVDPVLGSPDLPQSWNRYAYVQGNPLIYIDPDGRESAQIHLDNDLEDLREGKIDTEQYWQRIRARGEGALLGASLFLPGPEDLIVVSVLKAGTGFFGRASAYVARAFRAGKGALPIPKLRGHTRKLRNPGQVDEIKKDMLSGRFDFDSPEGIIAGIEDSKGRIHITEGQHRMNAALEIFEETGNPRFVHRLLEAAREGLNGRSYLRPGRIPADSRPLPRR